MVVPPNLDSVAARYGGYIDELHQFFDTYRLKHGAPEDIVGLTDRLASGGDFSDEMGSMVRSILYRESEGISRGELLELIAIAVGGPDAEKAPGCDESIRRLFFFVNDALRFRRSEFQETIAPPPAPEAVSEPVASARLNWSEVRREARFPEPVETASLVPVQVERRVAPEPVEPIRLQPTQNVPFARLVAAEESLEEQDAEPEEKPRRPRWAIPVAGAALVAVAAGVYLAEPLVDSRLGQGQTQSRNLAATVAPPLMQPAGALSGVAACVGPASGPVQTSGLRERYLAARALVAQGKYATALPEFQQIASSDPAFPGIHLDLANALAALRLPGQARQQLDWQIAISTCLNKLPPRVLGAYCRVEFPRAAGGDCAPQLAYIEQAAEHRSAVLRAAPERRAEAATSTAAVAGAFPEAGAGRHAPRENQAADPDRMDARPSRSRSSGERSLMQGDGTDSDLGAYSKPH
jgi:hypothetical protein